MDVLQQLCQQPQRFNFMQALRLLELSQIKNIKFTASHDLTFKIGQINEIKLQNAAESFAAQVEINFFGLYGSSGVLPNHYTELLNQRLQQKDTSLKDFLDIFHQRLIELFYKSWNKYRINPDPHAPDKLTQLLLNLSGLKTNFSSPITAINLLPYSGSFSRGRPILKNLENILHGIFKFKFSILPWQGHWISLDNNQCTQLSSQPSFNQLGFSAMLGKRVWEVSSHFTVIIGPLAYKDLLKLLPHHQLIHQIKQLIHYYAGPEFEFNLKLQIQANSLPKFRLSAKHPRHLGWDTCLGNFDQAQTIHISIT